MWPHKERVVWGVVVCTVGRRAKVGDSYPSGREKFYLRVSELLYRCYIYSSFRFSLKSKDLKGKLH